MSEELSNYLLSAAASGLAVTWGMLRLVNGRIRKLEINRVTPDDCRRQIEAITSSHRILWQEVRKVSEAVARIEGYLENKK